MENSFTQEKQIFTWKNVDIEVPNKNKRYREKRIKLVSNACGEMGQGLLAIMGPSGSGKTTLLNAFVGRIPEGSKTTGEILYHSEERKGLKWTKQIGFVDQDDTIIEKLTVYQTVEYAARFRANRKSSDLKSKIEILFKRLSISHIADAPMGKLSGGERKRVMIAVELVTDPKIIFLDEPTSGLDNNTTHKLIQLLKSLAEEGRTIIFTIHQPDEITAKEFNKILLLSQGRTVYMGDFKECEKYLNQNGLKRKELNHLVISQ